jgi:hypothetical protein
VKLPLQGQGRAVRRLLCSAHGSLTSAALVLLCVLRAAGLGRREAEAADELTALTNNAAVKHEFSTLCLL